MRKVAELEAKRRADERAREAMRKAAELEAKRKAAALEDIRRREEEAERRLKAKLEAEMRLRE